MAPPDPLREPGFLTEHQLPAVTADGNIFLTACPGSGKTRAGAARIARLADDGIIVAGCSYTNVGVEQIRKVISRELRLTLPCQHLIGTLHAFLLRYVLYPFGTLVTGSPKTPVLLPDDAGWPDVIFENDNRVRLPTSRFRFRPDGTLCVRSVPIRFKHTAERAAEIGQADAQRLKHAQARRGRLTFDDAMYWALQVLLQRPDLAAVVADRFDELVVDEAQDTSELQLACLEALCATGRLRSLTLIGDLEQSICAYTGASRAGCEQLATARGLTPVDFSENHRSSQLICDVAVHFCARETPDKAVGPDADCTWPPELLTYPKDEPMEAVAQFRQRLLELDHDERDAAVLARRNDLADQLNGHATPVKIAPRPLALGRAVSALRGAGTLTRRKLEAVEQIIVHCTWGTHLSELEAEERWTVRQAAMDLLRTAPNLDGDVRTWIRGAAAALGQVVGELCEQHSHAPGQVLMSAAEQEAYEAATVFLPPTTGLHAQTVHDIKGETTGAVLVVVHPSRSSRHVSQGALWSRPLTGEAVSHEEEEELRIAFVALTRAQRFCVLALSSDTASDVIGAFETAGFRRQ
jgi:DNA helicase II / ATP-dependent DNA helicase PcrA